MFFSYSYSNNSTLIQINIMSLDSSSGAAWSNNIITGSSTLFKNYSVNDILSFGGSGDKLLVVSTNEHTFTPNFMNIYYFTQAGISTAPS